MKGRGRIVTWFFCGLLVCSLIAFGVSEFVGFVYEYSGRTGRLAAILIVPVPVILLIATISYFILRYCVRRAGRQFGMGVTLLIAAVALGFGLSAHAIGDLPMERFLEGYAFRANSRIPESEAVRWAEQLFTNEDYLARSEELVVPIPQDEIPEYFASMYSGVSPQANISYSPEGRPWCVHIYSGGGFGKWGIAILSKGVKVAEGESTAYRQCSNQVYVFLL